VISVGDALAKILARARPLGPETVAIADAAGRVLAAPLVAALDNPPFDASAMDGFALRAAEATAGARLELAGLAQAGAPFAGEIGPARCVRIFTGAPVPHGADAVVMQEMTEPAGDAVTITADAAVGQNIRPRGNDFSAGDELLPAGAALTPQALALAAASAASLQVARRPTVALISTGDELVAPGRTPGPSQIVASNALALNSLLAPFAAVTDRGIVGDDEAALGAAVSAALGSADILITIGGASVGDRDLVPAILDGAGVALDFRRVAMRPGKPLMFGIRGDTLVFGLPGNPVSALVTAVVMVLPAVKAMLGLPDPAGGRLRAPLAAAIPANGPRRHFLRGRLEPDPDGTWRAHPFSQTDSAHLSSLARANALIVQPEDDPGRIEGDLVEVIGLPAF